MAVSRLLPVLAALIAALSSRAGAQPAATNPSAAITPAPAGGLSWGAPEADARFQVVEHRLVAADERAGKPVELLRLAAGNGSYIHFSRSIDPARIIEELRIDLAFKSDRAESQLLARAVLPRSLDPATGKPVTCLIPGSRYSDQGHWQTLRLAGVPHELERQARILRSRIGPQIDTREAYIDQVVVNLYTGPGTTTTLLGDLQVSGMIRRELSPDRENNEGNRRRRPELAIATPRLQGALLLIDGRPFFPRAIEHRGEPLPYLQQLGFNTIRFRKTPDDTLLDEAAALGLWVVCPPPFGPPVGTNSGPAPEEIAADVFDPVLAWDLGAGLTNAELAGVKSWIEQIRTWDRQRDRPRLAAPLSNLNVYGRHLDVLLLDRAPLGTSLELTEYAQWVRERPRLAFPGKPVWTALTVQPAQALVEQCRVLASNGSLEVSFSPEQVRLLVYLALAGGSRGLLIGSETRLDTADLATRLRAETLELLNTELALVEPWLAAGQTPLGIASAEPQVRGAVIAAEQARILLPAWVEPGAQCVPGQAAGYNLSLLLPGVPESHEPYELTAAGFTRPKSRRVAGGMRVTLDEFDLTSLVALTQDPLVVSVLERKVNQHTERATQLVRDLATAKLMRATEVDRQLAAGIPPAAQAGARLEAARKSLAECDRLIGEKKFPAAYREALRATRPLRMLERLYWDTSVRRLASPVSSPLALTFGTLVEHERWMSAASSATWLPLNIRQGEFENLQGMQQAGWRHFQHTDRLVNTSAQLSADDPHGGRYSLLLRAAPANPKAPPALIETPPLWITSPAVAVESGQTVRIRGWARVRQAITGSVDGLLILDSLSGEALAERIDRTEGWKEFTLYRAAPVTGRLAVTFALTGLGEAWIDDVRVELQSDAAPVATPAVPSAPVPGAPRPVGAGVPTAQPERRPPPLRQAAS